MTDTVPSYRWSASEFLRAWEAGAFDHRVELVNGEVWPVVIGDWHGEVVGEVIASLRQFGQIVTTSTLPSGDSLPDPDCWVKRAEADPAARISARLSAWNAGDVLLVVEVSDATTEADLMIKSTLYGAAGYPVYWVVTEDAIYEHTGPHSKGYRQRTTYRVGDQIPVTYADASLDVADLIKR